MPTEETFICGYFLEGRVWHSHCCEEGAVFDYLCINRKKDLIRRKVQRVQHGSSYQRSNALFAAI